MIKNILSNFLSCFDVGGLILSREYFEGYGLDSWGDEYTIDIGCLVRE